MKIGTLNQKQNLSFKGTTKVYALTDTHQESRKTVSLLSKILENPDKNILMLHSGDMGKGIYPTELEIDSYIKLKEARPDVEMVITMGNNDFGFNSKNFKQILQILKTFANKKIEVVCANIFTSDGKRPKEIKPYTIVERDGDKNFITGFCIDKLETQSNNIIKSKNQMDVIDEIITTIKKEKPDNVIILNHDFRPMSQKIINYCRQQGINVDLLAEGHDHSAIKPDKKLHIYHSGAYSNFMYEMDLVNDNGKKRLENIKLVKSGSIKSNNSLIQSVLEYEKENGIYNIVAPSVLNLTKNYSNPSSLGTFLADNMKQVANTDVGICSTGLILQSLKYNKGKYITNYDIKKAISGNALLKTVELNAEDLKEVFENAVKDMNCKEINSKFLQCSNNIKITVKNNPQKHCYEIKQIYINDKPLLDNFGHKLSDKKYTCAIDSFIADGGQGFNTLLCAKKNDVVLDNNQITLNKILSNALKNASQKHPIDSNYPHFIIEIE